MIVGEIYFFFSFERGEEVEVVLWGLCLAWVNFKVVREDYIFIVFRFFFIFN